MQTHHHYVLAHVALRQVALSDPFGFFGMMASPEARQEFLDDLWGQICRNCDSEGGATFTVRDLTIHTTRIGDYPTILVVMPPPQFTAEAHFVGIVLKVGITDMQETPDNPELQYFTLEKGTDESGAARTVLCAWKGETHVNFGDGPEATPVAFLRKVEELIATPD